MSVLPNRASTTSPAAVASEAAPRSPGRLRWGIGILLGGGVLINYFDRVNLSVAGPALSKEFGLSPAQLGLLFGTFFWSYALLQIPGGMLLDRLGVKTIGRWGAFLWSAASALIAFSTNLSHLFAARILLGIAETPAFPANSKATSYWFPRNERGLATALFDAAAKFSNVVGVPLVAFVIFSFGWRWGFGVTALLSFLYFLAFSWLYRNPSEHPWLGEAERTYIREGGAQAEGVSAAGTGAALGYLLTKTKIWGLTLGFAAYGYAFYLFLTWLPAYLVKSMHMTILQSAEYTTIPWAVATVTDLVAGGWLVDYLIRRGGAETAVRKTILIGGMVLGLAVFGAAYTTNPNVAIVWISIALGGLAASAPVGWSLPGLVAPKGSVGTVGGIMNFGNNIMGFVAPVVTGIIVGTTSSFANAFVAAGAVLLTGVLCYLFLLGRIEPIPEPRT
jgi:MFS transporter, ACS family, D-galactonate transporter